MAMGRIKQTFYKSFESDLAAALESEAESHRASAVTPGTTRRASPPSWRSARRTSPGGSKEERDTQSEAGGERSLSTQEVLEMTPSNMTAARFHEVNKPLQLEEGPVPEIREDEVLVQIKATGLCGSDVHIVFEDVTPTLLKPITLGHEPAGVVATIGARVKGWEEGEHRPQVPAREDRERHPYCGDAIAIGERFPARRSTASSGRRSYSPVIVEG